jgi:hypothetical protein
VCLLGELSPPIMRCLRLTWRQTAVPLRTPSDFKSVSNGVERVK